MVQSLIGGGEDVWTQGSEGRFNSRQSENFKQDGAEETISCSRFLGEPINMAEMQKIGEGERNLLPLLVQVLEALVERNDANANNRNQEFTVFHASSVPRVALSDYVERIRKYSGCSPCCFVVAVILMDRFFQRNSNFVLSSLSIHRILLSTVLVASKYLDDFYYNNAFWAKVGGVRLLELNTLELELLFSIRFNLHVMREEYCHYRETLLKTGDVRAVPRPLRELCDEQAHVGNSDVKVAKKQNNNSSSLSPFPQVDRISHGIASLDVNGITC